MQVFFHADEEDKGDDNGSDDDAVDVIDNWLCIVCENYFCIEFLGVFVQSKQN